MPSGKMTLEIMEYVVWVIEITARKFFGGDKTTAYETLKNGRLWDLYTVHYEVTHTLGMEYLLDEIREYLDENAIPYQEAKDELKKMIKNSLFVS
ncbi:MAG: DUF3791 domain-containing protein [Oscillospiraceae bacterium]|nr:DUF3791 domain-containing protein [Oscillospiraceae bacterium]